MTQSQYLRVAAARKEYALPRDRLYAAIVSGELPATDVGTVLKPSYLLKRGDIEAWMETLKYRPRGRQ